MVPKKIISNSIIGIYCGINKFIIRSMYIEKINNCVLQLLLFPVHLNNIAFFFSAKKKKQFLILSNTELLLLFVVVSYFILFFLQKENIYNNCTIRINYFYI